MKKNKKNYHDGYWDAMYKVKKIIERHTIKNSDEEEYIAITPNLLFKKMDIMNKK